MYPEGKKKQEKGEILKTVYCKHRKVNILIGYGLSLARSHEGEIESIEWHENGSSETSSMFNLTPIKKEWYKDESNFPCVVMQLLETDDMVEEQGLCIISCKEYFEEFGSDYRLATDEEVDSLKIKG